MPPRFHWRLLTLAAGLALAVGFLLWSRDEVRAEGPSPAEISTWTRDAVSADSSRADPAIEHLRAMGPAGLTALFEAHAPADPHADFYRPEMSDWPRLSRALDRVGGQYDVYASRLYWYNDLAQAKAAAAAAHKPLVVLYMLGKLTDEFSCANSRFFRSVLYTDPVVQTALREQFVLCWQSERPVPVVTIDMGDGRVLKRTITGNSIHYVLDEQGRVIDGIPGLYNPRAFATMLNQALHTCRQTATLTDAECQTTVAAYHDACVRRIAAQLQRDSQATGIPDTPIVPSAQPAAPAGTVNVRTALPTAESKMAVELPLVDFTTLNAHTAPAAAKPVPPPLALPRMETTFTPTYVSATGAVELAVTKSVTERQIIDLLMPPTREKAEADLAAGSTDWARLAGAHHAESALSAETLAYMRRLEPCATTPCGVEDFTCTGVGLAPEAQRHLQATLDNFSLTLAADTVRNEYDFHAKIHGWLQTAAVGNSAVDLQAFNERVYAELFLTPKSDPWLGLIPPDTFSALPRDGLVKQ